MDIKGKYMDKNNFMEEIKYCFVTGFYSGLLPGAPGTFASILGIIISAEMLMHFNYSLILFITFLFWLYGLKTIEWYEKKFNIHDDPKTAIDEIIGILFGILFIYPLLDLKEHWRWGIELVIFFALFRYFDIVKPGYIKKIDQKIDGALGTVLDDIIAAFYASIIFMLIKL